MLSRLLPAFATLAALGGATGALACEGKTVKYEASFDASDKGWGGETERFKLEGGKAVMTAPVNGVYWAWNTDHNLEDADICLTMRHVSGDWTRDTGPALMFWVKDNDNYFKLQLGGNKGLRIVQLSQRAWATPILNLPIESLALGKDPVTLRLTIKKDSLTVYADGREIADIQHPMPTGGGKVGVYVQSSEATADAKFEFTKLKVTTTDGEPESDAAATSATDKPEADKPDQGAAAEPAKPEPAAPATETSGGPDTDAVDADDPSAAADGAKDAKPAEKSAADGKK